MTDVLTHREPVGDIEPRQHLDAASAVVNLASRAEDSPALQAEDNGQAVERGTEFTPRPRYTQHWAMQGFHTGWVGFDRVTGLPK